MNANTNEDKVVKAVDMLRAAAPGATIIVFGSYARGETGPNSDVDFLVVEQQLKSRYEEMIRLREVLRGPAFSDIPTSQGQGVATPCLQPIIACS